MVPRLKGHEGRDEGVVMAMTGSSARGAVGDPAVRRAVLLRCFIGSLVLAAVALYVGPVEHLTRPEAPFTVPWIVLVAGFLLAEVAVVHYDFRSESHSYSLAELPLVFGLLFAEPAHVVTAQLVGGGAALVLHRRQTGVKLAFNLAILAVGACLAVLVLDALRDPAQVLGAANWLAALAAALVSSATSTLAIVAAISLSEGHADVARLPEQLALAALATTGSASLALLGAEASLQHASAFLLLAVPVGTFLIAYRSYVRQRQEHDSLEFLYESARILEAAPDLPSAMGSLLRSACRTFRAEVASFALSDADGRTLLVVATEDGVCSSATTDIGAVDALLQRGMALRAAAVLTLDPPVPGPEGRVLHEVMMAPVGADTEASGVLLLGDRQGTGTYGPEDLRLFETMTAHADVSLANGRLAHMLGQATRDVQRERRSSLELQRGLLPTRLPDRDDVDVAVRYQPSGSGAEVGGDWYDVLVLPSGALGVVIGDVIGHDLRSAARMAQARSALRAYATEGHDPTAVMERLNALLAQTDPEFMGTCCYAEVRPDEATVTFVLAGHPPPLLVPVVGGSRLVEAEPGLPLGVAEAADYPATTVALPPGAALVLYTDGLVESRTDSIGDGLQRITDTPQLTAATGVEEIAYRLIATMPEGPAGDDVALLVLRNLVGLARSAPLPRRPTSTVH